MAGVNPTQVADHLASNGFPTPSTAWIQNILSTQRLGIPLPAIAATTRHRLLSSNFAADNILQANTPCFPPDLSNPAVTEFRLKGAIPVQVLGVEDLNQSRMEQIGAIEAIEKGETTKGREVIRVVPQEMGENGRPALPPVIGGGTHRLVLQDWKGQRVYGIELKSMPKVGLGMDIGTKIILRTAIVARGVVLLEPNTTTVLGGKIEALHKAWLENRKKELKEALDEAR